MSAYIHYIATKVPPFAYDQDFARERIKGWLRDPKMRRLAHTIFKRSGISKRHSVSEDFRNEGGALFRTAPDGSLIAPGTAARNALYAKASRELAVELAREALEECDWIDSRDITHLIFTSCTGFCNPGPDYHVIRELGLSENIERYTLGFMGCYAAFPALRMAAQFCEANPSAVVLVMCLELCSLHIQVNDRPDALLASSLFADGAAASIVSAVEPPADRAHYRLDGFASSLVPAGEAEMAWDIGDHGFNIVLSSYVPDVIGANIAPLLHAALARAGVALSDIEEWAVHPGGRSILDTVAENLALPAHALDASRKVLNDYGNMSSATILFVLKEMLESGAADEATICAIAFGPGLTVETALLERLSARKVMQIDAEPAAAVTGV